MLSKFRVQRYKSLYDTEISLEPLTVFIGPNGSGKSNICESLAVCSEFINNLIKLSSNEHFKHTFLNTIKQLHPNKVPNIEAKLWQGKADNLYFVFDDNSNRNKRDSDMLVKLDFISNVATFLFNEGYTDDTFQSSYSSDIGFFLKSNMLYGRTSIGKSLKQIKIYDFSPLPLSSRYDASSLNMNRTGKGLASSLAKILLGDRKTFNELEGRFTKLIPNISRIHLGYDKNRDFELELIDKYSEHHIPASDISDGTLRILAFLTALYQEETPSIICFEEIENGVHPWLLHKMMELLRIVSTEGINGKPVQILLTTHSPLILNYVEPQQVRAVELDDEGKTQVHALPTDSVRFQKSLEAYDGELGELWFTNVFGGNPA